MFYPFTDKNGDPIVEKDGEITAFVSPPVHQPCREHAAGDVDCFPVAVASQIEPQEVAG